MWGWTVRLCTIYAKIYRGLRENRSQLLVGVVTSLITRLVFLQAQHSPSAISPSSRNCIPKFIVYHNNIISLKTTAQQMASIPQEGPSANRIYGSYGSYRKLLPKTFEPGGWDVICQRGRESYDHIGNRRFRLCINDNLDKYASAKTKPQQSDIVRSIVADVRDKCKETGGGFVRRVSVRKVDEVTYNIITYNNCGLHL
jgi:hypothetical protein